MEELGNKFFKVICEEVDAFGKQIHEDQNFGTIEEVHKFVRKRLHKYPNAKWELYVIEKYLIK